VTTKIYIKKSMENKICGFFVAKIRKICGKLG